MARRVRSEFYWRQAAQLLKLAASVANTGVRIELLEMAARFRQVAKDLESPHHGASTDGDRVARDAAGAAARRRFQPARAIHRVVED